MTTALVLGITADLDFAAGAFLAGFRRHNPDFAGEMVILQDGLPPASQAALSRLEPRLRLEPYGRAQARARLAAAGLTRPAQIGRALDRRSPMILAKFEMFDWLDRYETAVWCDVDMLVRAPVADLWQAGPLGWRSLADGALIRRQRTLSAVAELMKVHDVPLPNGGVVVAGADLRDRWRIGAADLYAMVAELVRRTRAETLDELALFLLASAHGIPVTALDPALNQSVTAPGPQAARILHAIGPDKFWNSAPLRLTCPDWQADHDRWVAAGGRPAPPPGRLAEVQPLAPDAALAAARNRAFWQDLWHDLGPALPTGLWPDLRTDRPYLRLYLTGHDRSAWAELTAAPAADRLRIAVGLERADLRDDGLPDRLHQALTATGLGLMRKDARLLHVWFREIPRDAVPATLGQMRDALSNALSFTKGPPCPQP